MVRLNAGTYDRIYILNIYFSVSMVLNPNEIEPTFLKLDSWSTGAGLISIITSNVLN